MSVILEVLVIFAGEMYQYYTRLQHNFATNIVQLHRKKFNFVNNYKNNLKLKKIFFPWLSVLYWKYFNFTLDVCYICLFFWFFLSFKEQTIEKDICGFRIPNKLNSNFGSNFILFFMIITKELFFICV